MFKIKALFISIIVILSGIVAYLGYVYIEEEIKGSEKVLEFSLYTVENKKSGDSSLLIQIYTKKEYSCSDYLLDVNVVNKQSSVIIEIDDLPVDDKQQCLHKGPAQAIKPITTKAGTWILELRYDGNVDRFSIVKSDYSLSITSLENSFSDPEKTELKL